MARRTVRISTRQYERLRLAAYAAHTSMHQVIRLGVLLYHDDPTDRAPLDDPLDHAILLDLDAETSSTITRLTLLTPHTWSGIIREAVEHATIRIEKGTHPYAHKEATVHEPA